MNWKKSIPEWVSNDNMTDHWGHPTAEAWVEEHENPETGEKLYLAVDTSGCNGGLIGKGVFDSFSAAVNAVGEQEGFSELWPKEETK